MLLGLKFEFSSVKEKSHIHKIYIQITNQINDYLCLCLSTSCSRWPVATVASGDDGLDSDSDGSDDALKWISSKEEGSVAQLSLACSFTSCHVIFSDGDVQCFFHGVAAACLHLFVHLDIINHHHHQHHQSHCMASFNFIFSCFHIIIICGMAGPSHPPQGYRL